MVSSARTGQLPGLLCEIHESSGLTYKHLSVQLAVSKSYISQVMNGKRNPRRDLLIALGIAWYLQVGEIDRLLIAADYKPLLGNQPLTEPVQH